VTPSSSHSGASDGSTDIVAGTDGRSRTASSALAAGRTSSPVAAHRPAQSAAHRSARGS
jgi:hypothetical protein